MKWVIAILAIISLLMCGAGFKDSSSIAGWQDRENAAFAFMAGFIVIGFDLILAGVWLLWSVFTS